MAIAAHKYWIFCVRCALFAIAAQASAQNPIDGANRSQPKPRQQPVRLDALGDPLPAQARFQFGTSRFVAPHPVLDLALSPDGKTLLTRDAENILCWDTSDGKIRWSADLDAHWSASYGTRAFAFVGNESFYSQSEPEKLQRWNAATGKPTSVEVKSDLPLLPENRPVNSFPGAIQAIDVTQDGSRIAAAGGHGVVVYDSAGNLVFEIPNKPTSAVTPADWNEDQLLTGGHYSLGVFSPDAKTLAVVTSDKPQQLRLLDASSGELRVEIELQSRVVRMAFNPEGGSIVTAERSGSVSQFSTATGNRDWQFISDSVAEWKAKFPRKELVCSTVAYSPDGKLLAAAVPGAFGQEAICVLDAASGTVRSQLLGHTQKPWGLAFTADSKILYSAGLDRFIRRWDVNQSKEIPVAKGLHSSGIVATAPLAKRITFSDTAGTIYVADSDKAESTSELPKVIVPPNAGLSALALSRDGMLVAGACAAKDELTLTVWHTLTKEVVRDWKWSEKGKPAARIGSLEFSPDGNKLAAANDHGKVYLLNIIDGKAIAELEHETVCGLSFNHTGDQLVTAGANEKLCFWDTASGGLLSTHEMTGGELQNVRCSPVDDLIVTAHFPNVLRMWNAKDMTLRKRVPLSGEANFESLAFSSDGNWLATGSSGVVNILNARTAERIWQAGSHKGRVLNVGFTEQDKALVSGGNDGVVYCWDLIPPGVSEGPDYDQIWLAFCGANEEEIKTLKWELVQIGDPAIDEVERRLKPITRVVNLRAISKGVDRETADSRIRLAMQLCEKNPSVEIDARLKNAIDFLVMLRNPKAIALLKQLATSHASKDVRKEAMFALETIQ